MSLLRSQGVEEKKHAHQEREEGDPVLDINSPELVFNEFCRLNYTWKRVEEFAQKTLGASASVEQKDKAILQLVKYRDVVDCTAYVEAVKNAFGKKFAVRSVSDFYHKNGPDGQPIKGFEFYILNVYSKPETGTGIYVSDPSFLCATITIKAPGSRTITSDIDTTLSVRVSQNIINPAFAPQSIIHKSDISLQIQAEIVKQFHLYNERTYGMTSATHRDSNVYSDGFLGLPKDDQRNHPLSQKFYKPNIEDVSESNEYLRLYAPYKKIKQQQELGASLISLCQRFKNGEDKGWHGFKKTVENQFVDFDIEENDAKVALESFNSAIIFVENRCKYANDQIANRRKQIQDARGQEKKEGRLKGTELNNDIEIAAINELYVEHLHNISEIANKLYINHAELEKKIETINTVQKERSQLIETIQHQKPLCEKNYKAAIETVNNCTAELALLNASYTQEINELREILKNRAKLQNEYQYAQITANLFAYEAYINRSAPYHVVEGMQTEQKVTLSKQTVMGSALQQIGFKLLHEQQQLHEGMPEGVVAYKTAKYGQRVGHLMFNTKEPFVTDSFGALSKSSKVGKSTVKVLSVLSSKPKPSNQVEEKPITFHHYFEAEEYLLINSEAQLANLKNASMSESERNKKALEILQIRREKMKLEKNKSYLQKETELWLSIAAKITVAGYVARLSKGYLWGVIPTQSTSHQNHGLDSKQHIEVKQTTSTDTASAHSTTTTSQSESKVVAPITHSTAPEMRVVSIDSTQSGPGISHSSASKKMLVANLGKKVSKKVQLAALGEDTTGQSPHPSSQNPRKGPY